MKSDMAPKIEATFHTGVTARKCAACTLEPLPFRMDHKRRSLPLRGSCGILPT